MTEDEKECDAMLEEWHKEEVKRFIFECRWIREEFGNEAWQNVKTVCKLLKEEGCTRVWFHKAVEELPSNYVVTEWDEPLDFKVYSFTKRELEDSFSGDCYVEIGPEKWFGIVYSG